MKELIFSPAVHVLNRLSFPYKFLIIFTFFFIPVVYFSYSSVSGYQQGMQKTQKERTGLQYLVVVRPLYEHMAQTRGMTNAYLNGKIAFKSRIEAKRAVLVQELEALQQETAKLDAILKVAEPARKIRDDWQALMEKAFEMPADEAFAAHTKIIGQVLKLMSHVLETSGLLLDPELESHFLMDAVGVRIPVLVENMGKARGLGSGIAAKGRFTPETYLELSSFIQVIDSARDVMEHSYHMVFSASDELKNRLQKVGDRARKATRLFLDTTYGKLLSSQQIDIDAAAYFQLGTEAISANLALVDASIPVLDMLLVERITGYRNNILLNIVASVLLLLITIYLFASLYQVLMTSIQRIKAILHDVANGDLTQRVQLDSRDELQGIATDINLMVEKTNSLVSQVINAAGQVVTGADEGAATSQATRDGVSRQNSEIEQVATAMNEMSATVHEVANNASSAAQATRDADKQANTGQAVVNEAIQSINILSEEMNRASDVIRQLEAESENIGSVLEVIRGIAEQTNLLALNAAIEAARAGEQGRGFAVVADEVRTLASRTQISTSEIQSMIERLQQNSRQAVTAMGSSSLHASHTVEQAAEAGVALDGITAAVDHIARMTEQIASAAEEQSSVAEEINRNVVNVRDIAMETVEGANQSAMNSETLRQVASRLEVLVSEFKVR